MKQRLPLLMLEIALLLGLGFWVVRSLTHESPVDPGGVEVTVQLAGANDKATLVRDGGGQFHYLIREMSGQITRLSPDALADRVLRDRTSRSWGQSVLNVSSPIGYLWVGLGLLGQVLFTGRMVVQWLVSEKAKKSTVPPVFWWMSLVGSSMLLVYFLWRQDPIGLLGQAFGWFIYLRNLWMIYRRGPAQGGDVAVDSVAVVER